MKTVAFAGLPIQSHVEIKKKPLKEHGLIMERTLTGRPCVNVPRAVVDHDPGGFDFGAHSPKDKELALNALQAALKAAGYKGPAANRHRNGAAFYAAFQYQRQFGQSFVFTAPLGGWVVPWVKLESWLTRYGIIGGAKCA